MKKILFLTTAFLCGALMVQAADYELVWNEDFTDGALDTNVWNIEDNGNGGGNNELQYYCEKGVSIERDPQEGKHCLVLTAHKESYKGKGVTSGRVNSKQNTYFTYGKIEARIWFPKTANGLWPAFWMMGNNFDEVGWPRCGETDIIELGHSNGFRNDKQEFYFNGAMHVGSAWNTVWSEANAVTNPFSVEDGFHIISCEWTPTQIAMYVDKDEHPELPSYFLQNLEPNDDPNYNRKEVFGKPNFIIFNLAVGGNFPGIFDINKITALANGDKKMYIDWVRVYQRGDEGQTAHFSSESDEIEEADPNWEPVEAVKNVQAESVVTKQFVNGRLVIVRGENAYDVLGNKQ